MIGVWPIIMGVTMWVQMKLNPPPPDPVQAKIFTWMPVLFIFMLANFPAGLVIYWAWNNILSVLQQSVIMKRQGVEIPLLENLGFKNNKTSAKDGQDAEINRGHDREASKGKNASRAQEGCAGADEPEGAATDGKS